MTWRYCPGAGCATAQYRWRITPGPSTSSSVTVAPAGTSVQSRFPPLRSQLDSRYVSAGLRSGRLASRVTRSPSSYPSYLYDRYARQSVQIAIGPLPAHRGQGRGVRALADGKPGNGACGSVWYQYATLA